MSYVFGIEPDIDKFTWDNNNDRMMIKCPFCGTDISNDFKHGGSSCSCYIGQMAEGEIEYNTITEDELDDFINDYINVPTSEIEEKLNKSFDKDTVKDILFDIDFWGEDLDEEEKKEDPYCWNCSHRMDFYTLMLQEKLGNLLIVYLYDKRGNGGTLLFNDKDGKFNDLNEDKVVEAMIS